MTRSGPGAPVPAGPGGAPRDVPVVEPDPAWAARAEALIARLRAALGDRAVRLDHVGPTSVPGLPADPVIDLDLAVADPDDGAAYLPALTAAGFVHAVREPSSRGRRVLVSLEPAAELHVTAPGSAEAFRRRLLRDWLREHPDDRDGYALATIEAASAAWAAGEPVARYEERKGRVVRDIEVRLFRASDLAARA